MSAVAFQRVPDGQGGYIHALRPVNDTAPRRRRRPRAVPDPLKASAESAAQMLRQFIERIDADIAEQLADKQDVYAEAKSQGFDGPTMTAIMRRRKKEKHVLEEADALFETYKTALGIS